MKLQPVILSGGSGTRLWPLSRARFPKQLLALGGHRSMLQETALRITNELRWVNIDILPPIVVTNEEYRFISAEQLREAGVEPHALILEPCGRNTAPALTAAALYAIGRSEDPVMAVMPADHVIAEVDTFREAIREGAANAEEGGFVTFGIAPTAPHTGYGYIRAATASPRSASALRAFVEKPDEATAQRYIASGEYLWNSGIFMMKASAWVAAISHARPEIERACREAIAGARSDSDFFRLDKHTFEKSPTESIDYAVMEGLSRREQPGAPRVIVIPLHAGWSDVGAWNGLWEIGCKDVDGNVTRGDTHVVKTRNSLIFSSDRLVTCVGLTDMVVVDTADAVLVANRSSMEQVKDVVSWLKSQNRREAEAHRKVYRPWGWYDTIDEGPRFQVKRIVVNPGAALSLQMHHHRAEHWVVVTGTAQVTRGEESFIISENQSTYIPLGVKHRLANPGKVPLEIIEVQSGLYLAEDDIVRFEDSYGRMSG